MQSKSSFTRPMWKTMVINAKFLSFFSFMFNY
jgi:hypothetical protein